MCAHTEAPPSVSTLFGGKLLRLRNRSNGSDTVNTSLTVLPCMSCSVETTLRHGFARRKIRLFCIVDIESVCGAIYFSSTPSANTSVHDNLRRKIGSSSISITASFMSAGLSISTHTVMSFRCIVAYNLSVGNKVTRVNGRTSYCPLPRDMSTQSDGVVCSGDVGGPRMFLFFHIRAGAHRLPCFYVDPTLGPLYAGRRHQTICGCRRNADVGVAALSSYAALRQHGMSHLVCSLHI